MSSCPNRQGQPLSSEPALPSAQTEDPRLVRQERVAAFRAGVQAIVPALIATATWGLVTGVAMVKSASLNPWPWP